MWLILSLFNAVLFSAQPEAPGPWVDLEKSLMIFKIKINQIEQELFELNKSGKTFATEKEKKEHVEKIRSLKQEKKEYEEQSQRLLTELRYRFPERGLRLLDDTVNSVKKPTEQNAEKSQQDKNPNRLSPELDQAIQRSMDTLRQQFGIPVKTVEEIKTDTVRTEKMSKKKDPIFDQLILSK